jgi:hypothetical protein
MAILDEAVATLGKWGSREVYQGILRFRCIRQPEHGRRRVVTVDVFEGQGVAPQKRYQCVAIREDGKVSVGSPAQTVEGAIDSVHWSQLDE